MWIHEATPANLLYQLVNETLGLPLSEVINYNAGQVFDAQGSPVNMAFYAVSFSAKTVQHAGPWPQAEQQHVAGHMFANLMFNRPQSTWAFYAVGVDFLGHRGCGPRLTWHKHKT